MALQKRRWKTRDGRLIAWTAAESAPLLPDYLPSGIVRLSAEEVDAVVEATFEEADTAGDGVIHPACGDDSAAPRHACDRHDAVQHLHDCF